MRNEFYWRQKKKPGNSLTLSGNLLKNPKLTGKIIQSTGLPQDWQRKYARSYENSSKIIVSGKPAILKIIWSGGGAKFGVTPQLKTKLSPGNYSLQALARTSRGSQAMLSVGNYQSAPVKAEKWQQVSVDFKVIAGIQPEPIYWNLGSGQTEYKTFSLVKINRKISRNFPITALAMPVEINRLTSGREEFNSFADSPVPLAFDFKGDGRKYKINKLVLEIPAALKISEAFDSHLNMHRVETPETVKITRNGKPFLRYSYTNPKIFRALKPDFAWERKLILAIEPSTPNLSGQSFPIYWYITAGPLKGQEQQFIMNLLPPLNKTNLPKNFPILCWRMNDINYINPEILKKVAANYEKAGIKYYKRSYNPNPQLKKIAATLGRRGWKKFTTLPDYYAKRYYRTPFPVNKIKMAIDNKGKLTTHKMCPTYFNRDQTFRTDFHKLLDAKFAKDGTEDGDMICYDTEPWQPMEWCLCETCRKDFAKQYKMKSVPSITTALTEYSDQWRDFRSAQTAETLKLQTTYLRKKFPNSPILDYDYVVNYNDPNYRSFFKSVAKDPLLNEQYFDTHLASYYHHTGVKSFDLLKCNIEKLTKPYYVVSAIDKIGYLSKKYVLSPARIRLLLLASAVNGAEGFSIYPGMHLDGAYLKMFNQTLPIIAELDSFFKQGTGIDSQIKITALPYSSREIKTSTGIKTITRPNWNDFFRFRAQQVKHETLISLFNYNPQKTIFVKFSLKLNAGNYTIINAVTGQRMLPNNGQSWPATALADITAKIAPVNTTLLLIRKYRSSDDKLPVITQQQLQQEFSSLKSSLKSYNSFKPRSSGKLKISADDIDGDSELEVVLSSPDNKIWISPRYSGSVVRWQYKASKLFGWNTNIQQADRILCTDRFWLPKAERGPVGSYKIISTAISDNRATVKLQAVLQNGLTIIKTFTMTDNSKALTIDYQIKNNVGNEHSFAFWVKSYPIFGNNAAKPSTALEIPLKDKIFRIFNLDGSKIFPVVPGQYNGFNKKYFSGVLAANKVTAVNSADKSAITVKFELKQLAIVYVWSKTNPTLELIYRKTTVAPGKTWKTAVTLIPVK